MVPPAAWGLYLLFLLFSFSWVEFKDIINGGPFPRGAHYAKQSRTALRGLLFIGIVAAMYVARDFLLPVVALGMPSPFLWGLLTFFVNFIPYVGALAGGALSTFMAIVKFDTLGYALFIPWLSRHARSLNPKL